MSRKKSLELMEHMLLVCDNALRGLPERLFQMRVQSGNPVTESETDQLARRAERHDKAIKQFAIDAR